MSDISNLQLVVAFVASVAACVVAALVIGNNKDDDDIND